MSYECYVNIESPKLSFDNVSLSGIGKGSVYPLKYFLYKFCIDSIHISTHFYVLQYLNDVVLGTDATNKLNLVIKEDWIQTVGKSNKFPVGHIRIVENSIKELNCAANSHNEKKISAINSSQNQMLE